MSYYYEYELGKAAKILCEELFKLKPGETFVITADTESDDRVVDATARAAFACDAKPMVIYTASPWARLLKFLLPYKPYSNSPQPWLQSSALLPQELPCRYCLG
ncbi:unnamed protein product, partial [marine sediment metagenome]